MPKITFKIPYYRVVKGRGFWEPRGRAARCGFKPTPCGPDGPAAWAIAESKNKEWRQYRDENSDKVPSQKKSDGFVYFMKCGSRIKIGFSLAPMRRAREVQVGAAAKIDAIAYFRGSRATERRLQARLSAYRTSGEWFVATGPVYDAMLKAFSGRTESEIISEYPESTQSTLSEWAA